MSLNLPDKKIAKIWVVIQAIPKGTVASYGQVADLAGLPGRARLTARALRLAPNDMKLPWFRVLRSNGQLAPQVAQRQKALLKQEGILVSNNRVKLAQYQWQPSLTDILFILEE